MLSKLGSSVICGGPELILCASGRCPYYSRTATTCKPWPLTMVSLLIKDCYQLTTTSSPMLVYESVAVSLLFKDCCQPSLLFHCR